MTRMRMVGVCGAAVVLLAVATAMVASATALTASAATPPLAPVADAAMRGDVATLRLLIARGASVNVPQGDGMTALHWAAQRGDLAMTEALLRAKANVRAVTRINSYTPLHVAAREGQGAVVQALLKAGADPNALSGAGASALHLAAASGNTTAVTALLDRGADANARESEWGQTPLIFAAEFDRADAIKILLKRGADASIHSKSLNLTEETARDQAAARKRAEVLVSFEPEKHKDTTKKAVAGGADVPAPGFGGRAGAPPAATPVAADAAPGGFGARGGRGGPPMPQPVGPFTPAQIQAAIDSGRAVLLAPSAAKGPVVEVVDTINGGIVGFQSQVGAMGGLSALHHAVRQGNVSSALALLDGGAKINDPVGAEQTTPLLLAAINGHFDLALQLVARGADPNIGSTAGNTPLYATINTQWAPRSRFPQPQALQSQKTTHLELMEALLKAGAKPNVRLVQQVWYFAYNNCGNANCGLENIEGTTPFWRATYSLDLDAMKLLLKYGADPTLPSLRTPPPVRVAGGGGRGGRGGRGGAAGVDSTGAVAAGGGGGGGGGGRGGPPQPPLDPATDSAAKAVPPGIGVYAIHAAAGVGYGNGYAGNSHRHAPDAWMPTLKFLVEELHMDVNARDLNGYTPLHHAASRGDNEMILYLVSKGADVRAVARNGRTTVDMANGPVSRISPIPETIALLEKLGAKNSHRCQSC